MADNILYEMAKKMIEEIPETKREVLRKALGRNAILTGCYILENGVMTVYKEGYYLELSGCRSKVSIWAADNDGEMVFGRKPVEAKLHKLYERWLRFNESDFESIA